MKTYESKRQLAERYGISVSTVENLRRGPAIQRPGDSV
jgi:transposase